MAEKTTESKTESKTESTRDSGTTASRTSSSTLTTDTAAMGTATDSGTPEPGRTLRGTPFGVSGDVLNPAFAAPRDEGHERNLKEARERAEKQQ